MTNSHADDATGFTLIAVDGSQPAQVAAHIAVQLAKAQNYAVHGLSVVDETLTFGPYANYKRELTLDPELVEEGEQEPENIAAMFEVQADLALTMVEGLCQEAEVPYTGEILAGGVDVNILSKAKKATLVAVGRRGNQHPHDVNHLGSHFLSVVRHVSLPIIVGGDEDRTVRHLLLAYNSGHSSVQALQGASALQRALAVDVTVALIDDKGDGRAAHWQQEILARLPQDERPFYQFHVRQGDAAAEIAAAAIDHDADLIVVGGQRHRPVLLRRFGSGTAVEKLLRQTPRPVLIV